jgi:hypothetical protein
MRQTVDFRLSGDPRFCLLVASPPNPCQQHLQCWLRTVPALFFLALLRSDFRFLLFLQAEDVLDIGLVDKQLSHFFLRLGVLGLGGFLLRLVDDDVILHARARWHREQLQGICPQRASPQ